MALAAGGLIKQNVVEDPICSDRWEDVAPLHLNVQILNSEIFRKVTKEEPPSTPLSAASYAEAGLPFFKLYEEPSKVFGSFKTIKSVAGLDQEKGLSLEERSQRYPLVHLNESSSTRFRPVSELIAELRQVQIVDL